MPFISYHRPPEQPQRIVSLVPSQTETLYHLGMGDRVIALTRFCVHPSEWYRGKIRIGGTKSLHLGTIASLEPDLIIGNKEENTADEVIELSKYFPTWVTDVSSVTDGLNMIADLGALTHTQEHSVKLATAIATEFELLKPFAQPIRTLYLIWRRPWMAAGGDTFISDMMQKAGMLNVFADRSRYPTLQEAELLAAAPQLILLPSEPYPFKEGHLAEIKALFPEAAVRNVDGEMMSWYGSRMLYGAAYLRQLAEDLQQAGF
ncbi:MAG: helical backbone metal receptor [Edaphocola sp.]